jgi:oxygen-independent coproporphyrinogen-3 oxidase
MPGVTAAYLHIPFCRRRCFYCDFPISVVGDRRHGGNSQAIEHYVDLLCQEIALTPAWGPALETVFFGGGTPSLLTPAQLSQLLDALDRRFGIAAGAELSIEMDPGTFDRQKAQDYWAAGISRVSLGAQAFQDELLAACGRTHRVADIEQSVDLLRSVGCDNLSLDLISGLPGQSLADWQTSLKRAIALAPEHLSAYDLVLEPTTVFGKRYEPGEAPLPTDDLTAALYRLASQVLRAAGYDHYEISNYARPGRQCRHNRIYWENQPFYGFGLGAASFLQGVRFSRPRTRQAYAQWLAAGALPEGQPPDPLEALQEQLMLGLRLAEGINLETLAPDLALGLVQILKPEQARGWVVGAEQRLRLSDPEGFLFSNQVLSKLFAALETGSLLVPQREPVPLVLSG